MSPISYLHCKVIWTSIVVCRFACHHFPVFSVQADHHNESSLYWHRPLATMAMSAHCWRLLCEGSPKRRTLKSTNGRPMDDCFKLPHGISFDVTVLTICERDGHTPMLLFSLIRLSGLTSYIWCASLLFAVPSLYPTSRHYCSVANQTSCMLTSAQDDYFQCCSILRAECP